MRRIGTLSSEREAQTFSDYLLTLKIETQVSGGDSEWEIWLLDEDRLEQGRSELEEFRASPGDPKYAAAVGAAKAERDARLQADLAAAKRRINLRERWERPVWMQAPVTIVTVGLCLLVTFLARFGNNHDVASALQVESTETIRRGGADFVTIPDRALGDVSKGQLWRLVTPILLHFDPIHLLGNSLMMLVLGRMIEGERGSWRLLLYVLLTAVVSNLAQNALSGPNFGGLSGVVYGMFGYAWLTGRMNPHSGLQLSRQMVTIMLVWLILCTTGAVGNIANTAHFVGLGMGLLIAGVETTYRHLQA